jgi:diguanylate cyclase (GGDEF)-like protein
MTRDRVGDQLDDTTRTAPGHQAPASADGQAPAAYLVVLSGSSLGEMHKVDQDRVVIGRGDKVDLRLIDDGISREHAQIVRQGPQLRLEDLGSTNGTYCNGERIKSHALAEGDKILLGSATILKFSYQDRLDEMFQRQMSDSALRDGLTHAFNKRYFAERIETEFQYAVRHGTALSLIFLDIDQFKRINDLHGHQAGDYVLTQLATLLSSMLDEDMVLARYGGEELVILARGEELDAAALAERLRAAVEAHPFTYQGAKIPVTVSIGVARASAPGLGSPAELIARADETMYAAKRAGRNRVHVAK